MANPDPAALTAAAPLRAEDVALRPERFALLRVPAAAAPAVLARLAAADPPYFACIREDAELTLLVPEDAAHLVQDGERDGERDPCTWRVITFLPALPWTVTGFLAAVTGVLAGAGIPLGALAAYARDHLFVKEEHATRALTLLRQRAAEGRQP